MLTPAERAASFLVAEKDPLAREVTRRLYEALPGLMERYGEEGRRRCLQDMGYNLEHLAPAVELEAPEMFAGYVRWLDGLLRARGISTAEVARSLELTEEVVGERLSAKEAAPVRASLRAGIGALGGEGGA